MQTERILLRPWQDSMLEHIRKETSYTSLISSHFVDNPASGRVLEKCGFKPTGETAVEELLYSVDGRPMRVLRLELYIIHTSYEAI